MTGVRVGGLCRKRKRKCRELVRRARPAPQRMPSITGAGSSVLSRLAQQQTQRDTPLREVVVNVTRPGPERRVAGDMPEPGHSSAVVPSLAFLPQSAWPPRAWNNSLAVPRQIGLAETVPCTIPRSSFAVRLPTEASREIAAQDVNAATCRMRSLMRRLRDENLMATWRRTKVQGGLPRRRSATTDSDRKARLARHRHQREASTMRQVPESHWSSNAVADDSHGREVDLDDRNRRSATSRPRGTSVPTSASVRRWLCSMRLPPRGSQFPTDSRERERLAARRKATRIASGTSPSIAMSQRRHARHSEGH